jgi:hypothetical protein
MALAAHAAFDDDFGYMPTSIQAVEHALPPPPNLPQPPRMPATHLLKLPFAAAADGDLAW